MKIVRTRALRRICVSAAPVITSSAPATSILAVPGLTKMSSLMTEEAAHTRADKKSASIVLWCDDDRDVFSVPQKHFEALGVRVFYIDDSSELVDRRLWRYFSQVQDSSLIFLRDQKLPDANQLHAFFHNVPVTGVVSDLDIGGNAVAGMVILSAAVSSSKRPETAVFSGRIDEGAKQLSSALGVNYVLLKSRRHQELLLEILAKWLGIETQKDSNKVSALLRRLSDLETEVDELKAERNRLSQELEELVKDRREPAAKPKHDVAENELKKQLANLESRVQMVLAHHHDLTNTSSLTVQALEHVLSDPTLVPPILAEELERARISAKHCDVLVSSLTTLTAEGEQTKEVEPASLDRAIREAVQIVRRKIPDTISLNLNIPAQLPLCRVPEHLLVRCLLNLLLNSLEALSGSGKIEVVAKLTNNRAGHVTVSVIDSGRGIKKSDLPKVFRADFSTKGKTHGLGLFIVKQILDDFGGSITFDSERGKVTVAALKIPKA